MPTEFQSHDVTLSNGSTLSVREYKRGVHIGDESSRFLTISDDASIDVRMVSIDRVRDLCCGLVPVASQPVKPEPPRLPRPRELSDEFEHNATPALDMLAACGYEMSNLDDVMLVNLAIELHAALALSNGFTVGDPDSTNGRKPRPWSSQNTRSAIWWRYVEFLFERLFATEIMSAVAEWEEADDAENGEYP